MIQVDLAWAYGVGSSFAVVAQRQLIGRAKRTDLANAFLSWPFLQVVFFVLFILGPFTAQLLWAFPDWQLMYAFDKPPSPLSVLAILTSLPAVAVAGYILSYALLQNGRRYLAFCQFALGYFLMFFGLSYGWDGTGYQRLFSVSRHDLAEWSWEQLAHWSQSEIAATFNLHMAVIVPYLLYFASYWISRDSRPRRSLLEVLLYLVALVFIALLGCAVLASIFLINLPSPLGLIAAILLLIFLAYPRWGLLGRFHRALFDPLHTP